MQNIAWLGTTAAVVGVLVKLLKSGIFAKLPIPKNYLPWVALGLGLVSAVIHILMNKDGTSTDAVASIVEGAVGGLLPVAVHELGTRRE